jgi:hypothetical protein
VNEDDTWVMGLHSGGIVNYYFCVSSGGSRPAFLIPSNLPVEVEGNPLEQYSTRELAEEIFRRLPN